MSYSRRYPNVGSCFCNIQARQLQFIAGWASKILIDKVQRVQNAAVRLVPCTHKYDRITPVLKELHWLPVKEGIIFKILLFTYKARKALAPRYISDFLVQYKPPRALRSSDKKLLQVPHFKLRTYWGRSFSYIAPYLWNQLPNVIRQASSITTFKSNPPENLFIWSNF